MKQPFAPPCRWWLQMVETIATRESFLASTYIFTSELDTRKQRAGDTKQKRLLKELQKLTTMSSHEQTFFRRLPRSTRLSKKTQRQS